MKVFPECTEAPTLQKRCSVFYITVVFFFFFFCNFCCLLDQNRDKNSWQRILKERNYRPAPRISCHWSSSVIRHFLRFVGICESRKRYSGRQLCFCGDSGRRLPGTSLFVNEDFMFFGLWSVLSSEFLISCSFVSRIIIKDCCIAASDT